MDRADIVWTTTSAGWQTMIRDGSGRTWVATITRSESDRAHFTATILCQEHGIYRSDSMAKTVSEAQDWCYKQLELSDLYGLARDWIWPQ